MSEERIKRFFVELVLGEMRLPCPPLAMTKRGEELIMTRGEGQNDRK